MIGQSSQFEDSEAVSVSQKMFFACVRKSNILRFTVGQDGEEVQRRIVSDTLGRFPSYLLNQKE
jgi:hypothetical protein